MEKHEQAAVIGWSSHIPEIRGRLFHIPNGGSRHKLEAVALKRQGVRAGVSDLFLPVPKGKFHGMWIEMKAVNGAKPSKAQQEWLDDMESLGYAAIVAYGAEQAINGLKNYLALEA